MNTDNPVEILEDTKAVRLKLFFEKLNSQFHKFRDIVIQNNLYKMPTVTMTSTKKYYLHKIKPPISYESKMKYRIRVNKIIYDLYRTNKSYYFVHVLNPQSLTQKNIIDFSSTIQYSFIFYLFYSILKELTDKGITIELHDLLFSDLTKQFHTPGGDLKIFFTQFPMEIKECTSDKFYLSLFN